MYCKATKAGVNMLTCAFNSIYNLHGLDIYYLLFKLSTKGNVHRFLPRQDRYLMKIVHGNILVSLYVLKIAALSTEDSN